MDSSTKYDEEYYRSRYAAYRGTPLEPSDLLESARSRLADQPESSFLSSTRLAGDLYTPLPLRQPSAQAVEVTPATGLTIYNSRAVASNSWLKLVDIFTHNLLTHPFITLRRTCQVNRKCSPLVCVPPFRLIPFVFHQYQKQGIFPLFKGLSSELTVKALMAGTEAAISNYTGWPMEFTKRDFVDNSFKYVALKTLTVTLITPFLCSSAIQTVQSAIVVKDRTAFVECLKEGLFRSLHLGYGPATRLLPIWILAGPTVLYHVSHLILFAITKKIISLSNSLFVGSMLDDSLATEARMMEINEINSDCSEISTNLLALFITEVALFPVETVMHSLYLQGSRILVDNCDETTVVLPVITNYDGFSDCFQSILKMEGLLGLYKGLGGLFLQFSLHYMIIRLTHYAIRRLPHPFERQNRTTEPGNYGDDKVLDSETPIRRR